MAYIPAFTSRAVNKMSTRYILNNLHILVLCLLRQKLDSDPRKGNDGDSTLHKGARVLLKCNSGGIREFKLMILKLNVKIVLFKNIPAIICENNEGNTNAKEI